MEHKQIRLKVESSGGANCMSTKIIDAETGAEIHGISEVRWRHRAGELPEFELIGSALEAALVGVVLIERRCGNCGQILSAKSAELVKIEDLKEG